MQRGQWSENNFQNVTKRMCGRDGLRKSRKEGGKGYGSLTFKDGPKVEFAKGKRGELMVVLVSMN